MRSCLSHTHGGLSDDDLDFLEVTFLISPTYDQKCAQGSAFFALRRDRTFTVDPQRGQRGWSEKQVCDASSRSVYAPCPPRKLQANKLCSSRRGKPQQGKILFRNGHFSKRLTITYIVQAERERKEEFFTMLYNSEARWDAPLTDEGLEQVCNAGIEEGRRAQWNEPS